MPVVENLFERHVEKPRDFERKPERGVVLAGFYRIYCLSAHLEMDGQIGLAPVSFGAKQL